MSRVAVKCHEAAKSKVQWAERWYQSRRAITYKVIRGGDVGAKTSIRKQAVPVSERGFSGGKRNMMVPEWETAWLEGFEKRKVGQCGWHGAKKK